MLVKKVIKFYLKKLYEYPLAEIKLKMLVGKIKMFIISFNV